MYSLLSLDAGAARRVAIAFAGVAMLAACDTDRAISPNGPGGSTAPSELPTSAAAAVTPTGLGNLILTVVDGQNSLLGNAKFKILGPQLVVSFVTDNEGNDADPAFGKILLKNIKMGGYQICEIIAPAGFALPDVPCRPAGVYSGATTGVQFLNIHLPYVQAGFVDRAGAHIGGGIMTVKDSTGTPIILVSDNGGLDVIKIDGYFSIMLPYAGKFTICGTTVPAGYAVAPGYSPCLNINVAPNKIENVGGITLNPTPSAAWAVNDPFVNPIGPSTFTISIPRSLVSLTVVDNGLNDLDLKIGRIAVKLPKAGVYTLCETVAPANRWVSNPACRTVDVAANASVDAGVFVNYEKQVYKP